MRRIHAARSVVTDELLPEPNYVSGLISPDDFDEYDNWGPGTYAWIDVDDDVAAGWDAGLDACEAAGVSPLSRAGIELRWRAIHGDAPVSERLLAWVERVSSGSRPRRRSGVRGRPKRPAMSRSCAATRIWGITTLRSGGLPGQPGRRSCSVASPGRAIRSAPSSRPTSTRSSRSSGAATTGGPGTRR